MKTFIAEFGVRKTVMFGYMSVSWMALVVLASVGLGILPYRYLWLAGLILPCYIMLLKMITDPYEISDTTGNHPVWLWYYVGLVAIITGPLIIELAA